MRYEKRHYFGQKWASLGLPWPTRLYHDNYVTKNRKELDCEVVEGQTVCCWDACFEGRRT